MSNLYSYILSLFLLIPTLLFSSDLFALSAIRNEVEQKSTTLSLRISISGGDYKRFEEEISNEQMVLTCLVGCNNPQVGESVKFRVSKFYKPLFISKNTIEVASTRTALIGYY